MLPIKNKGKKMESKEELKSATKLLKEISSIFCDENT